jgi:hypothetical protein
LSFRDLPNVKRTQFFCHFSFQKYKDREKKISTWRSTRQEKGGTTWSHLLAMWWAPYPTSWTLFWISSPLRNRLDLKMTVHMTHPAISWRGGGETKNTKFRYEDCDGGPFITMMNREYLIPGLWDCESNMYQSLCCASIIIVTWVAYHDCDHICITLWWIFCYWEDLWYAN